KALGGGILPIAAVVARRDLDVAGDYAIGHYTHEKNPVTARAALETLAVIREEGLTERAATLGSHALATLAEALAGVGIVGDIRGRGLLFGIEIVTDRDSRAPAKDRAERIYYRCLAAGLSFKISAGAVLTLSPPLVIAREDLDRALVIVTDPIRAEAGQGASVSVAPADPRLASVELSGARSVTPSPTASQPATAMRPRRPNFVCSVTTTRRSPRESTSRANSASSSA